MSERNDSVIQADLDALRRVSVRELPSLETTCRMGSEHLRFRKGNGLAMLFTILRNRPKLSLTLGTVVLAATLVVIPMPYSRTVGYDVSLDLKSDGPTAEKVARELRKHPKVISAEIVPGPDGHRTVTARSRGASRQTAEAIGSAVAASLRARGIATTPLVAPVRVRVTGNIYAMARDRVLRLEFDESQSSAEIEASLRQQLQAAGLAGEAIARDVDGTKVFIFRPGDDFSRLEINGETIDLSQHLATKEIAEHLGLEGPGMTIEEVARRMQRFLDEKGIPADVTVVDGQLTIEPRP